MKQEPADRMCLNGLNVEIFQDEYPPNPREAFSPLGKMVCFHRRYELGDKVEGYEPNDDRWTSWEDLEEETVREFKPVVIMSLRLYDHSGISISVSQRYPYNDRWDSGQVGYIFATREDVLAAYGKKRMSRKLARYAKEILLGEVEEYNQYLTGDVWGYKATCPKCGWEDSLWGIFGHENIEIIAEGYLPAQCPMCESREVQNG